MDVLKVTDFGEWELEDVAVPDPAPDEVLVQVNRVQLSVTECLIFAGETSTMHDIIRERMVDGNGRIFGHEFCGTITEAGDAVTDFEPGDRVYSPGHVTCGTCTFCRKGYKRYCENQMILGFHRPGATAEYFTTPPEPLTRIPDGVSNAEGAALQPLAGALLGVHDANVHNGDVVCIIGSGVMGFQCGQLALVQGADRVYAIDIDPDKLELATDRGMVGVDSSAGDAADEILAATDGVGADLVFECVGGDQSHATSGSDPLAMAHEMVRPGGRITQIGIHTSDEIAFEPREMREKMVSWINPRDYVGVLSTGPNSDTGRLTGQLVASGRVSISELITHELEGLESFGDAVDITLNKEESNAFGPAQLVLSE